MELKVYYKDSKTPYDKLAVLLREAFQERVDAGLNFGCASFLPEELKECTLNSYIVCLFDHNIPIAMGTLSVQKKFFIKYGWIEFACVSPMYKNKGIGSCILQEQFKIAKKNHLHFVLSTTAIKAESSVRYHLKNGFRIYSIVSYKDRDYESYQFCYPLSFLSKIIFSFLFLLNKKINNKYS